ncbi:MAG: PLP-dependent aminotransferase family protein [Thermomicrobiales bacterium]|nr:PLP-dependent aminotransferase family protein [Thermomicrobiales bacterium]MCO5221305.1 PLP-dependent aminotransferase family protein [Thermomicrobiales bacterium]
MVTTEKHPLDGLYSKRGRNISPPRVGDPSQSAAMISFIYGFPDPDSLPAASVADAAVRALESNGKWALQYGATMGAKPLVDVLLEKLKRDQGIDAKPENVMITAGGSQAVGLIIDLFVDWDDMVLMEAPTWMGFIWGLKNVGAKMQAIPMEPDGMDLTALRSTLEELRADGVTPKMIYIIPNFQNPTGISMSLAKRKELIEIAHEFGTIIFEDDAYHDLRFSGEKIPSIYSLDPYGLTIYTATFSKTMGAGMRLGWLVAPKEVIQHLGVLKIDGGTNVFGSYVAAEWIPENLPEHLTTLREIYHRRKVLMIDALGKHMPEGTTWTDPDGGFFVWVTLPEGLDTLELLPRAREMGIEYMPGGSCYPDGGGENQLRLSYSFASDEQIEPGIEILATLVKGELMESASK